MAGLRCSIIRRGIPRVGAGRAHIRRPGGGTPSVRVPGALSLCPGPLCAVAVIPLPYLSSVAGPAVRTSAETSMVESLAVASRNLARMERPGIVVSAGVATGTQGALRNVIELGADTPRVATPQRGATSSAAMFRERVATETERAWLRSCTRSATRRATTATGRAPEIPHLTGAANPEHEEAWCTRSRR